MNLEESTFGPVRRFGELALAAAVADLGATGLVWFDAGRAPPIHILVLLALVALGFGQLLVGVGVLRRARWGYPLLVWDLRLLCLGFPLGFRFPRAMLRYLREHRIDRFFQENPGNSVE